VIVLDASAAVAFLLGLPGADEVGERLAADGPSVHAPHMLSVEVAQVVRRLDAASALDAERGVQALVDLADLDVTHHPHEPLLPLIWERRRNLTAYDAVYVALAEALDAPLLTLDRRVADAPGHRARIDLIG
jgi:predicted nucleic acid-binding protein